MRLVNIESPYAGHGPTFLHCWINAWKNFQYLRAALRDSLYRGEAPIASHLIYPSVLNDRIPAERAIGMNAGFAWNRFAEATIVYTDRGVSEGMKAGIDVAKRAGRPVEYRRLY